MNKRRREEIKQAVLTALEHANKLDMPVNIKHIVKCFPNCRLISYTYHMSKFGLNYFEMLSFTGSEDACTDYDAHTDRYVIYYNDRSSSLITSNRYRWNIAHELGHVLLRHHKKSKKTRLFRNTLSTQEYRELETEADCFASYLLVPYAALEELTIADKSDIERYCRVSSAAAQYRYDDYLIWNARGKFSDYFDYRIRQMFFTIVHDRYVLHKMICTNCRNYMDDVNYVYCPICGKSQLKYYTEEESYMIYNGINTDESGKAIICPVCENEEVSDGDFCKICGFKLINACADTPVRSDYDDYHTAKACSEGSHLDSNARYCPHCGNETAFYRHKILKEWRDEKQLLDITTAFSFDEDDDLPPF